MKVSALLAALATLFCSAPVFAHRLNQYLQAATIAVAKDHLILHLHLTPGVAVAPRILGEIGIRPDDTLSSAAEAAYAERIREHLSLSVDDAAAALRLTAVRFPTPAAIRGGLGDIDLTFAARLPPGGSSRQLSFVNANDPDIAVYLVNCLVPDDPDIRILAQTRTLDQSRYQLGFELRAPVATDLRPADSTSLFNAFLYHGIRHILTGYDHLLFACALVLAVTSLWELVKVVTAFTVAHSITLTLATLNVVHVPAQVVEPIVAASIVFVALQNLFWPRTARGGLRVAVAFVFGLFHGLGFAGGLLDLLHELPRASVLLAILGFSIGVEVGQQFVLLPLFGVLTALRRATQTPPRARVLHTSQRIASALIATAGTYYLGIALLGTA